MDKRQFNYITIVAFLLILILLINLHFHKKAYTGNNDLDNYVEYQNDSTSYYRDEMNKLISERNALIGDKKLLEHFLNLSNNDKEQLQRMLDDKAKVDNINTLEQETIIDTIIIEVENNLFDIKTPYYEFSGTQLSDSIIIDRLYIPNKISLLTSTKNGITSVKVNNSNPFIHTTNIESYIHDSGPLKKKRKFGVGIQVGYNIEMKPYIGIGVSYNIFSF